jgi:iron-sulfur cluster repair protein YtfE (RIC family)
MTSTAIDGQEAVHAFVKHEHDELAAGIDRMHEVACDLTTLPASEVLVRVGNVLRWVDETLRPHMAWEETWLFPQIDERARTPWATRLVRFDHRQISRQAERVGTHRLDVRHGPAARAAGELRCDLLALEALVRANLEREERFLLPILETPGEPWNPEWRG